MHPNRSLLLAGTAALFLAACSSDTLSPTGPAAIATARRSLGDAAAAGPGPFVSGLAPNLCADVWTESRTPGAEVKSYGCHGGANQQFALEASGAITAYGGALCLDVWGARANDGDAVVVWTCHGGANQRWTRTPAGELRTAVNGKCLDLWGGRAKNGANIAVHTCNGGGNQKWTVRDAAPTVTVTPQPTPAPTQPVDTTVQPIAPPVAEPIAQTGAAVVDASAGTAELPRTRVDVSLPTPTGRTISVPAGGDLQGALNAAAPGDVVVLAPGATFVGNFDLPAKANAAGQWITVRTGGALPAPGTRVSPADAGQMPKILTPNAAPALKTVAGSQGWRLIGLEVGATSAVTMTYFLVGFGDAVQNSLSAVPSRLVLDRSYVHGHPQLHVRRCVSLNSAATAVVDSYLSQCHSNDGDSQAIYGWNGPGPFRIENNYLEGGHEVVAFGGSTPAIAGLIPSDMEIRRNHITRPLSWRGVWRVKNLFELKSGQRVLLEGNVLENNWADAQTGFAILFQGLSDENNALQNRVWDVTLRNNIIRNTPQGVNLLSRVAYNGGALPTEPMRRITLANNIVVLDASLNGAGRMVQVLSDVRDATISQNTFVDARGATSTAAMVFDAGGTGPAVALKVQNNVFGPAEYPVMGNGTMGALGTFAKFAPDAILTGNVFVGANSTQFPGGNYFPSTLAQAGLSGVTAGSYQLTAQYPSNPGANVGAVATATQGAVR